MKQTYSVLRRYAEGEELKVVAEDFETKRAAIKFAKNLRDEAKKAQGGWANDYCVAILEFV